MLDVWPWGGELNELRRALAGGRVLAIPTESSYGLAVDPTSEVGVQAIYRLKRRERGKPLPVVAASVDQAIALGVEPSEAFRQAAKNWPAALTVVARLGSSVSLPAAAGGSTLAVRVPDHERLRGLLGDLGHALTATSANRSGTAPACDLAALEQALPDADVLVIGGEATPGGPPSTVVSCDSVGLQVLRPGRFTF